MVGTDQHLLSKIICVTVYYITTDGFTTPASANTFNLDLNLGLVNIRTTQAMISSKGLLSLPSNHRSQFILIHHQQRAVEVCLIIADRLIALPSQFQALTYIWVLAIIINSRDTLSFNQIRHDCR